MITIDFQNLSIRPNDLILDIGCGEGRHTISAGQKQGTICVGADFGFENLVETKKKLAFHNAIDDLNCKSIDLSCMDITTLPFKDNSFDVVICSEVLEHIPDDNQALSELARIVKPGKTLAISVPRYWPEKICWMLSDEYFNANMGHVRIYKKNPLIRCVESFGFSHFHSHHAHSIHAPYWWLKCFFGPNRIDARLVNLYHRILVWDLMKQPQLTSFIDKLFNPILGKSLVLYFIKQ
ncbi:MAG: class I SAM-dependent methyltransferase [Bacteroidales bacterium]|nr:class I SAM-dependent methyltransferase [Bacteroidales bacterium]